MPRATDGRIRALKEQMGGGDEEAVPKEPEDYLARVIRACITLPPDLKMVWRDFEHHIFILLSGLKLHDYVGIRRILVLAPFTDEVATEILSIWDTWLTYARKGEEPQRERFMYRGKVWSEGRKLKAIEYIQRLRQGVEKFERDMDVSRRLIDIERSQRGRPVREWEPALDAREK